MPSIAYNGGSLFYREAGAGRPLLPGNTASSACHAGELLTSGAATARSQTPS